MSHRDDCPDRWTAEREGRDHARWTGYVDREHYGCEEAQRQYEDAFRSERHRMAIRAQEEEEQAYADARTAEARAEQEAYEAACYEQQHYQEPPPDGEAQGQRASTEQAKQRQESIMTNHPQSGPQDDRAGTTEHELKCWPECYSMLVSGSKTFEIRKDDRGFRVGDVLWLREWRRLRIINEKAEGEYTGREMRRTVTYVLSGLGLERGCVCMSLTRGVDGGPRELGTRPESHGEEKESQNFDLTPLTALVERWTKDAATLDRKHGPGAPVDWRIAEGLSQCASQLAAVLAELNK